MIVIAVLYILGVVAVAVYDRRVGVDPGEEPNWIMTGALSVMWPMTLLLFVMWVVTERRQR